MCGKDPYSNDEFPFSIFESIYNSKYYAYKHIISTGIQILYFNHIHCIGIDSVFFHLCHNEMK